MGELRCYTRGCEEQRRHASCAVPTTSACRSGNTRFLALPSMNSLRVMYRTPTCTQHSTSNYNHPPALSCNGSMLYAPHLQERQLQVTGLTARSAAGSAQPSASPSAQLSQLSTQCQSRAQLASAHASPSAQMRASHTLLPSASQRGSPPFACPTLTCLHKSRKTCRRSNQELLHTVLYPALLRIAVT